MLRIFLGRFIKGDAIKAAEDDLSKVKLDDAEVQLPDSQLGIGHKTWAYLSEDYDLDTNVKNIFISGVRDFYRCVTSTITKKFSFKDTILEDVLFVA